MVVLFGSGKIERGRQGTVLCLHPVLQLYYLQSRYYDPEIGRFINADAFASTGQGILGNNMYAYCGNNPVSREDDGGEVWEVVAAGAVAAIISGVFNAINTASAGGSLEECLLAVVAGMVGGAVGFVISVTAGSPLGDIAARATATIVSDLGTNLLLNGKITSSDVSFAAVDATMDVCFSTVTYYYNPVKKIVPQTAINAAADGIIDHAQTELLYSPRPAPSRTSAPTRNVKKLTFMERRLA